ncbi:MAG TPA: hypothetical protein VLM79_10680, partial [Kofleriaceae bacterium]|nr:hypothetical protein [Kofleriaceae bacterium]
DRPAAATKKPLVRSKPPARPVVRTPARPAPTVAKAPAKRGTVIASAAVATPAAAPTGAEAQGAQTSAGSPIETDVQAPAPEPAPAPAPPADAPAPAQPPAQVAAPKPAASAKPAAPSPGSLDATPTVISVEVKGSLSPSIVRRSVERTLPSLRTCYRLAARAAKATPGVDLRLSFEIDENSLATQVQTSGANFGSLATCAAGVTSQIRTQEAPDVGTAQVTAVIRFRPS